MAFLPRSLQNWILSIFQNIYQARNQKIISFHLHCFNYFVPTFSDYFFLFLSEKCLPVHICFLIGLVFLLFICRAFTTIMNIKTF